MDQIGTYVKILRESLERKRRYLEEILALTNKQSLPRKRSSGKMRSLSW